MKKLSLIGTLLTLCVLSAYAVKETEEMGVHPYKQTENVSEQIANWSIFFDGGLSAFDADAAAKLNHTYSGMFGLGLHYDFTPTWGVAISYHVTTYGMNMFDKNAEFGSKENPKTLGHMNTLGANLSFDFMDAFFPHRQQTIFNVYGLLGGGVGLWNYNGMIFEDAVNPNRPSVGWAQGNGSWDPDNKKLNATMYMMVGVQANFNVCRGFDVGIKAYYDYFVNDYVDGGTSAANWTNKNNDGMFAAMVNLNWKLESKKKSHVRNFASEDALYSKIDRKKKKSPASLGKDTIVIYHKDTIVIREERTVTNEMTVREEKKKDDVYFVYFETDKSTLDREGERSVQQMASRMQAYPEMCVDIAGYCDAVGGEVYNTKLAEKRAQVVRDRLVNVYGIDAARLLNVGVGRLTNVDGDFGPNRRVEMRVVTRERLEELRQSYREKSTVQAEVKKVLTAEELEALKAKYVEQVKAVYAQVADKTTPERWGELNASFDADTHFLGTTTTTANTTLSRLARQYYDNNPFCWVYIYLANLDAIKNPNLLTSGVQLGIPELTTAQKTITKEESLALYEAICQAGK